MFEMSTSNAALFLTARDPAGDPARDPAGYPDGYNGYWFRLIIPLTNLADHCPLLPRQNDFTVVKEQVQPAASNVCSRCSLLQQTWLPLPLAFHCRPWHLLLLFAAWVVDG